MRKGKSTYLLWTVIAAISMATMGCSTQKNTAQSRWWHAFNARYNTYYNGTLAYIDGSLEKENGNKDNYTEQIPLYTVGNKDSRALGKNNFERAIEKCEKAIHLHSIKRRPEWSANKRKTAKDREWLSRREYNPFIWKAWMLMGRAQFYKGDFEGAAATFAYMARLFATQPAIYAKARAWLAKCYIEQGWTYDAEDVIRNMQRDSIHWRAQKEWDYTYADYYLHTGEPALAIGYLRKVIGHEMRRKQKAREWFLMGQLQAATGNQQEAYKAFRHVVRLNPPYELEFNARIAMSEVMGRSNSKAMISKLRRMASSDKNKEYLDQVYYAIGNIHLSQGDTLRAIDAYEKGNQKATRNGIEKGVLLLRLGNLYWDKEKFADAKRCLGEAIGLLDKDRKDYAQLSQRSKILDELVPYTDAIQLQDSLQELARMTEKERNAAIDRVISALKKKEKEERDRQAEAEQAQAQANNPSGGNSLGNNANRKQSQQGASHNAANSAATSGANASGDWYFYSPPAVSQGKAQFQKLWGKRDNVDNWQRVNKTVVAEPKGAEEMTDEARDSLANAALQEEARKNEKVEADKDPHNRAYYLAQIPFKPEQMEESNKILKSALYSAGVIMKDKLNNLRLGEKELRRLVDNYPPDEHTADAYYHLFLLYSRKGQTDLAQLYKQKLKEEYPDNAWTTLLYDPYYAENAKMGKHLEDSLYTDTYQAFKENKYDKVRENARISATRFPEGDNRDKFLFIGGLSRLNDGDTEQCLADMKQVVEKYPDSRLSEMAGMIINGVNAGRRLYGGKFDLSEVWSRRAQAQNANDSTKLKGFSEERETDFTFLLAYQPDSVNENQLLFEVAKYNFTSYLARNFDISIEAAEGIHRMAISGFSNYDEARQYANAIYQQEGIKRLLGQARSFIISRANLELLGTALSYEDYEKFYAKHFAPIKISKRPLLLEPEKTQQPAEEPEPATIDEHGQPAEEPGSSTTEEPASSTEIDVEEKEDDSTDTGIYFDDESSQTQQTDADEYYDLNGF